MLANLLLTRKRQGSHTMAYPHGPAPTLPNRFPGMPGIVAGLCMPDCPAPCIQACSTEAVTRIDGHIQIDTGKCLFCRECGQACPCGAIRFTGQHRLAAAKREDLIIDSMPAHAPAAKNIQATKSFGHSFALRVVSAGGCGACEADVNVLNTLAWDLGRFGIHYVASPRHADGLLVTGPVTKNMEAAVRATYAAIPDPKYVIAVGTCAVSGGMFLNMDECNNGVDTIIPVDLYIPGCPPHPLTILDGLLGFLDKCPDLK
jgi:Ni,Fe-hydrogenase III small subunit